MFNAITGLAVVLTRIALFSLIATAVVLWALGQVQGNWGLFAVVFAIACIGDWQQGKARRMAEAHLEELIKQQKGEQQ